MSTITKTQIAALKAAESGGLVKFGYQYWKSPNHVVQHRDYIPDQKYTFGTRTINVLIALELVSGVGLHKKGVMLTNKGYEVLALIKRNESLFFGQIDNATVVLPHD